MPELPFPDPPLAEGDLVLRAFSSADVPAIAAACQDPEIPRWTHVPAPYDDADARQFLMLREQGRAAGSELQLAIVSAGRGPLLGSVGLEAGARRRGVATRSVRLLSGWAVRELGMRRIELLAHPDNEASQRVALGAGFTREGLLRAYRERKGEREDLWMFSLLAGDVEGR
jgi:RimJ/RimL family protein N-acetyltransferase